MDRSPSAQFPSAFLHIFHIQPFCAALSCGFEPSSNFQFNFLQFHLRTFYIDFSDSSLDIFYNSIRIQFQFQFLRSCVGARSIEPPHSKWSLAYRTSSDLDEFTIFFSRQFCWCLIRAFALCPGQLTMQGPGFGLDQLDPLPPPVIPPPRTPPCPPGLSRLGTATVEQATSKTWRWFNKTTKAFFQLLLLPAHLHDLLCSTTPTVAIPKWLETGGSARASCQHLFRSVSNIDFQLHYFTGQVAENFKWIQSQLQRLADGGHELTLRLTQLEILTFNLDALIEGLQEQIRWMPQKDVRPKSQPKTKAHSRPRPSSVLPAKRNFFKRKMQRSFMKKVRTHEGRLQSVETSYTNIEKTIRRNKQLNKKVQELEDQLDKQGIRLARLMKTVRNTERCLRENGLLRDDQRLSESSGSEIE